MLILCFYSVVRPKFDTHQVLYSFGLLLGALVCFLIIDYESNTYNSFSSKLCAINKKADCSPVLRSSASKLYGVQWSTIGLSYFLGMFFLLLNTGERYADSSFSFAVLVNLLSIPYIFYSAYYQIFVARHLCILCSSIIIILMFLLVVSLMGGLVILPVKEYLLNIPFFIIYTLVTLWGSNLYISLKGKNKLFYEVFSCFNKLRYKRNVLDALLEETSEVENIPTEMTINIGNMNAPTQLLKVCNPYCAGCSQSQIELNKLLNAHEEIGLRIMFAVSAHPDDRGGKPVKLFLALKERFGDDFMEQVLTDWYSQENKNYDNFRSQFNIDEDLIDNQVEKLKWMEKWCQRVQIHYTPTFYVNGRILPEDFYSYNDFKMLFS